MANIFIDLKLIVLFLEMCPVDLFASAEKKAASIIVASIDDGGTKQISSQLLLQ